MGLGARFSAYCPPKNGIPNKISTSPSALKGTKFPAIAACFRMLYDLENKTTRRSGDPGKEFRRTAIRAIAGYARQTSPNTVISVNPTRFIWAATVMA